ncbi:hypothetical protein L0244_04235 [bacterium]|nr:hypothetical protein [bacterium]
MGLVRYVLVFISVAVGISIAIADCEFSKPETVIGKADVTRAVKFKVPKKNNCFPNRGAQLGKIEFQYEFPEGSNQFFQVIVYYDSTSHCYLNENEINCSQIQAGAEIGDVRYFERESRGHAKRQIRGVLNRLFVVP